MGLLDFFSQEAGQARRRWLDESAQGLLDDAAYYIGPHAMGRVNGLLGLGDMLNPVSDIGRAGQAAQDVFGPGRTATERTAAAGSMMTDMASVLAPAAAAKMAGSNATQAIVDALANLTIPADDAVQRFATADDGAIRAFHGSPHDFDRFSMGKIGTGEGAQAYGHGLYFAESEDVARNYRSALAQGMGDGNLRAAGVGDGDLRAMRQFTQSAVDPDTALRDWLHWIGKKETPELRDAFMRDWSGRNDGRLYEVNINANPEDFLDWDRPLSEQPLIQGRLYDYVFGDTAPRANGAIEANGVASVANTPSVRNPSGNLGVDNAGISVANAADGPAIFDDYMFGAVRTQDGFQPRVDGPDGQRIYRDTTFKTRGEATAAGRARLLETFTKPKTEAEMRLLRDAGIPGIRYLDAGSRTAGDGSRNYVVFDENLIEIVKKYGIAGAAAMLGLSASEVDAATQPQGLLQ